MEKESYKIIKDVGKKKWNMIEVLFEFETKEEAESIIDVVRGNEPYETIAIAKYDENGRRRILRDKQND